jgi:hypothetical protein
MKNLHLNGRSCVSVFWLAIMTVLLWNPPLSAQFTTASFNGTVVDASGGVVPDAKVTIRNIDTGFKQAVTTDAVGVFLFPRLPVGNYRLTVEKPGFFTYVQDGITLTVNRAATQAVTLRVGEMTETITVAEEVDVVTTGTAAVGHRGFATQWKDSPIAGFSESRNRRYLRSILWFGL